jgi:pimeloyl-ACP methyl ester carboxylesterase
VAHFLLLHGACHGGWCWEPIVPFLHADGHDVTAPDLPCEDVDAGLADYAEAALSALPDRASDVVVVAHSLGALVAPIVANRVDVRRMVFIAGIIGAPGASLEMLAVEDATRDLPMADGDLIFDDAGRFCFSPAGARRLLYHDCEDAVAEAAIARLRRQRSMWTQVAAFDAWPATEIVSITCTGDRVVNPGWSNRVARERLGVEPLHLAGGHSPFLARPAELAAVLTSRL